MSLAAGRLRHRVTIEQKVITRDPDTGAVITAWQPFATDIAAEVVPLSAKEFMAAQAMQSQITARITTRYRAGMSATMRVLFRGRAYNIAGVLADNVSGLEYITLPVIDMGTIPASIPASISYLLLENGNRLVSESGNPIVLEIAA